MMLDLYVRADAWYHRLDPRTKFGLTLLFAAAAALIRSPLAMFALLALLHILPLSSRVPLARLLAAWRPLWPITLIILVLGSFTWGAASMQAWWRWGQVSVGPASVLQAVTMALRVDALAFAFSLLLWTTEQGELVAGLTRLGLPHSASLTLAMSMQFVPTFGRIFSEIMEAQESRGLVIPRSPLRAARAYLPVLIPLIITALRTVDHLAMALAARGYGAARRRTGRRQLRMRGADALALAGGAVILLIVLLARGL
ncbi:MAG: energy-coupling factor transporter transmembrane component T family protein [Anaerolineae bacterium]